jgi:hypothetical protein
VVCDRGLVRVIGGKTLQEFMAPLLTLPDRKDAAALAAPTSTSVMGDATSSEPTEST